MTANEAYKAEAAASHAAYQAQAAANHAAWKAETGANHAAWKAQAAANHAAWQAELKAKHDAHNAAQDARRAERENHSRAQRPAPTATAQNPANWAEVLILQTGYRAAAMANHPDRGGDHNRMVAINAAYSTLKAQGRI